MLEYEATDSENLIADYKKFYAYGADGLAYRKDIDGSVYTYNTSYRGDVLSVMDDERNIKAEYMYDAYGNLVDSNVATGFSDNFGYRGEYTDPESGYIYLRMRYFDPKTGRFLTEDPIRDGLNWFAYCDGNPVKYTDPWGLGPWDHFSTRDEAAADFGFYIGQQSIDIEEEFASCIFKGVDENNKEYFFYDKPRNDLKTHEERSIMFMISWDGTYGDPESITHAHGAYDANTNNTKDSFSFAENVLSGNDEMSDAYWSDKNGIDYYVVTPNGNLKLYTANSKNYEGELIRSDMIVDSRIEIHQQMQNTLLWRLLEKNFPNGTPQDYVNAIRNNPDSLLDAILELERFR